MISVADAILFVLPAYIANSIPVLLGGGKPIDLNLKFFDGKPIFGESKTIRGAAMAIIFAVILSILIEFLGPFGDLTAQMGWRVGMLLGIGAVSGDLFGSFIKRRMGMGSGKSFPVLDQDGFVFFALLFAAPLASIPLWYWAAILMATPFVHLSFNFLAYKLKWKDVWY